ncbi:hypothetical protein N7509_012525 [Penicillium cosmopolitanum]|uniref:Secreted LysM effector LysM C-terminal domain-containing protein n=1 Tax=Penicillium cosmopolitanum TaxID=1131564 RepID=A0A9W9VHB4_9EURO|nr:uncharacterized protein N7509_012525 [Penicillium cosmopolitanum]KAJ5379406.1 hypothetical protein N7509_012525 [Penicillium cosmopolitanum]
MLSADHKSQELHVQQTPRVGESRFSKPMSCWAMSMFPYIMSFADDFNDFYSTTSTTAAATTTKSVSTSYTTIRITADTSKESTTTTTTKAKTTTTKSKTTTSKGPEKTGGLFSIAIYSSRECSGDYGLSSISTGENTWCKWYFDGGFNSTDCDSGDKLEIGSIYITSGSCNIYDTEDCQSNGKLGGYDSGIYTKCHAVDNDAPKTLGGLKCSHKL